MNDSDQRTKAQGGDGAAARATNGVNAAVDGRKAAIRAVLTRLAEVADTTGLASTARDIRDERLTKLDEERFSLVVLGEFNHGKSSLINALLGEVLLPVGVTPTTAVLARIRHGAERRAEVVFESGKREAIEPAHLPAWLTVEAPARRAREGAEPLAYVDIRHPAPLLAGNVTLIDTPGVNDINEQRADITYGYIPRADAVLFLIDATQALTASERQFLEERILRTSRDRMVFVVTKADLLDEAERKEVLAYCRQNLAGIVPEPAIFPVSSKKALGGDAAAGGFLPLLDHLRVTFDQDRRRLLLDHALADASRLAGFVRQSLGIRRRSLDLPLDELAARVGRAEERLKNSRRALDEAAETIRAETTALKARVRQDLAAFAEEFAAALPKQIEPLGAPDVQRHLGGFVQDTWKRWVEQESEMMAGELERLAEKVVQVANENADELTRAVASELDPRGQAPFSISVDTFRYDASIFALGALGTTVFLFVNTLAGGLLTLAAPVAAMILRGRVSREIKAEAKERAPEAVRQIAATIGPKLDEIVDRFAGRLEEFVAQAGAALARGIAEVLERALAERRRHDGQTASSDEGRAIDEALTALKAIEEEIVDVRQRVWGG
jgi:small GTP-binding protein